MSESYFTLRWFQIENLLINRIHFLLFDLCVQGEGDFPPELRPHCQPSDSATLPEKIKALGSDLNQPIILLCEDGSKSSEFGQRLGDEGYTNVFVVEGGRSELLKEWRSSKNG